MTGNHHPDHPGIRPEVRTWLEWFADVIFTEVDWGVNPMETRAAVSTLKNRAALAGCEVVKWSPPNGRGAVYSIFAPPDFTGDAVNLPEATDGN